MDGSQAMQFVRVTEAEAQNKRTAKTNDRSIFYDIGLRRHAALKQHSAPKNKYAKKASLLFVVRKFETGYDNPSLTIMYIWLWPMKTWRYAWELSRRA
jgi:type I site-specific restriction-modification system R (restriction) subunit